MTCIRISEKFWLDNPIDLFSHLKFIPNQKMGISAKCNTILRLSILIFLVLLFFNYKYSYHFLIIALIINISFYYKYKSLY